MTNVAATSSKPTRRRLQFGLRTMMLATAACALVFAWWRERDKPVVAILHSRDPQFSASWSDLGDSLTVLSSNGREQVTREHLSIGRYAAMSHVFTLDPKRKRIFIREITGRITCLATTGKEIFSAMGIRACYSLTVDEVTGNLWCTSNQSTVVLDPHGKPMATYSFTGFDIVYNSYDEALWIVGKSVTKIDRHGRVRATGPHIGGIALTAAPDPRDGSVWIVERQQKLRGLFSHQQNGVDRLIRVDSAGRVVKEHQFAGGTIVAQVACDPSTGTAWLPDLRNGRILRVPAKGAPLAPLPIAATDIAFSRKTGDVWIATASQVRRVSRNGKTLVRYQLGPPSIQACLAAF